MKITGYRCEQYQVRFNRPIGDVNRPTGIEVMQMGLLWIDTDEGVSGLAFSAADIADAFPLIEGRDPREVVGLWRALTADRFAAGSHRAGLVAAIDVALWDLKAKLAAEPLWRTFGATAGRVKAYASGIEYPLSDDEVFAFYRGMAERGVDGGKLKMGMDLTADIRRIGVMRDALSVASPRPRLMVDVNEYWSPKQTVRFVGEIEKHFDLTYIEEPARRWDYRGLASASRQIRAGVATGENLHSIGEVQPLIQEQAVDFLNVTPAQGGFTGCRQIAHLAHAYELPVTMMNAFANYSAHLAAALPNHFAMEVLEAGFEQCLQFEQTIEDGFIVLSERPGLGIEVDTAELRRLQADPPTGSSGHPFTRRPGAGLWVQGPEAGELGRS
jgi:L-alanine-DL-glutamate epimerase-like enolase superfamily enzyme